MDRAHERAVCRYRRGLHRERELEIFPPERVLKIFVRAAHEHHLRHAASGGAGLINGRFVADGVAVDIQHERDVRILGKIRLDGRRGALIRARVARIVVERAVVQHAKAVFLEHGAQHVAHTDDRAPRIGRAVWVARRIFLARRGEICLRAVRMYYQNLRPLRAELLHERLGHERDDIRFKIRFVPDLHAGVVRERHDLRRRLARGLGRDLRRRLRRRFRGRFGRRFRSGFGRRLRRWFRCQFRRQFRRRLRCDLRCRRFDRKVVREQELSGGVRVAEFEREQRRTETPAFISLGGALDRLGQRPGMEYQLRHNCRAQQLSLPFHRSASPAHRYYLSYGAAAENMPTAC